MKYFFALLTLSILVCQPVNAQCKSKDIVKKCKANLKPFKYDGYAVDEITFDQNPKIVEVEFTAYAGQDYKLVFCSSGFTEEVKVNIYDKNRKKKDNRKQVYNSDQGIDNLFWSFEPPKTGTYFIEYEIPKSADGKTKTGCIVLLIGYK